jgi:hypothetical protein
MFPLLAQRTRKDGAPHCDCCRGEKRGEPKLPESEVTEALFHIDRLRQGRKSCPGCAKIFDFAVWLADLSVDFRPMRWWKGSARHEEDGPRAQ